MQINQMGNVGIFTSARNKTCVSLCQLEYLEK